MQLTVGPEGAVSVRDELSAALDRADEPAIQRMIVANLLSMEDLVFGLTGSVTAENVNLIHLFLDQGAEPNDLGQMYGFVPATLLAAESLNVEVIRAVFSHGGDPTVECAGGATPLLCLIEVMGLHGNVEMVEPVAALVELGADPEYCSPEARFTPLEMARGLRLESVAAYLEAVIRLGAAGDDTIEL